ncbi:MAG TPA: ABC transporter permease [Gemmatimonadaceae bacterium]|nr:ABC transporter permease [Gemmatimonadaceae bacterium]
MRSFLDAVAHDIRYALRGLRNRPGFTTAVVVTLGLGIGANSAMFSIVDRLLFRAPPMLRNPALMHRVYLAETYRGQENESNYVQYARYTDLTNWTQSFARTAEFTARKLAVGTGAASQEMQVGIVSASFFRFFDAPPVLGRYFTSAEDTIPGGAAVAVISYPYWERAFGSARDVLGKTVHIGAGVFTVIGVAPKGFVGLWSENPPVAFIPITNYGADVGKRITQNGQTWYNTFNWTWASMIAERKSGVTTADADADLTRAFRRSYAGQLATKNRATPMSVTRPHAFVASILADRGPNQSSMTRIVTWISGVALIVWLIACANVANLLLARALRRRREIAVRLALGVSRGRLASQLMAESGALALLGGVAGIAVAQWGGALLRTMFLSETTTATVIEDPRTLLFVGVASAAAGLLTGLAPLLQTGSADLTRDLKAGVREGTYHGSRMRTGLLTFQATLSVLLLIGAGLFVRSLSRVQSTPLGYDAPHVAVVDLHERGVTLDSTQAHNLRLSLLAAATALPDVEHASMQVAMPFWSTESHSLYVAGIDTVAKLGQFDMNSVTPDYFATMGTRILRGRGITQADVAGAPKSMVVSQSMARKLWPHADAIGQCVKMGKETAPCTYVVGVAEDIKNNSLSDDPALYYYVSWEQFAPTEGGLFVRTRGDAARSGDVIRKALQAHMPGVSYVTVTPMSDVLGGETQSWRVGATMFLAFGLLALVLAAVGLYSVIAYNVAQRAHELGVRVALGAQVRDVMDLVLRQGMVVAATGVVLGAGIALAASRWVGPLLFDESARDPVVYGAVAIAMLAVAAVASFIPARRAARVDPVVALRTE